jgi:hypothetical protein
MAPSRARLSRSSSAARLSRNRTDDSCALPRISSSSRSPSLRAYVTASSVRMRNSGIINGLGLDVFATAPEMIAVSFDARRYMDRKFSALAAHRSAFGVTLEMLKNPPSEAAQILQAFRPVVDREGFLLGGTRGPVRRWPLPDLSTDWKQQNSSR